MIRSAATVSYAKMVFVKWTDLKDGAQPVGGRIGKTKRNARVNSSAFPLENARSAPILVAHALPSISGAAATSSNAAKDLCVLSLPKRLSRRHVKLASRFSMVCDSAFLTGKRKCARISVPKVKLVAVGARRASSIPFRKNAVPSRAEYVAERVAANARAGPRNAVSGTLIASVLMKTTQFVKLVAMLLPRELSQTTRTRNGVLMDCSMMISAAPLPVENVEEWAALDAPAAASAAQAVTFSSARARTKMILPVKFLRKLSTTMMVKMTWNGAPMAFSVMVVMGRRVAPLPVEHVAERAALHAPVAKSVALVKPKNMSARPKRTLFALYLKHISYCTPGYPQLLAAVRFIIS